MAPRPEDDETQRLREEFAQLAADAFGENVDDEQQLVADQQIGRASLAFAYAHLVLREVDLRSVAPQHRPVIKEARRVAQLHARALRRTVS